MDWAELISHIRQKNSRHRVQVDPRCFDGLKKTEIGKETAILAATYALYSNAGLRQDQFDFLLQILNTSWGDYAAIGVVYGLSSKSFDGKQFIDSSFNGTKKYPEKSQEDDAEFSLQSLKVYRRWSDVSIPHLLAFSDALTEKLKVPRINALVYSSKFLTYAKKLPAEKQNDMFSHVINTLAQMLIENSSVNEMKNLGKTFLTDFCNDKASIEGVQKMCAAAENSEYDAKIFVIRVSGETINQNSHLRKEMLPIVTPLAIATLAECDDDDEAEILKVLDEIESLTITELRQFRQSIVNLRFRRSVSFNITLMEIFQKHSSKIPTSQFWNEFGIFDESDERFLFNITLIIDDFVKSISDESENDRQWITEFFKQAVDGILNGANLDKNGQILNILALMTLEIKKTPDNTLADIVLEIFKRLASDSNVVNSFEILNLFDFILTEVDEQLQKSLFRQIMAARVDVFVENKSSRDEIRSFEEVEGISNDGSAFKNALVPEKESSIDQILQAQLFSMIEKEKDAQFQDISASVLKNINPENIILLLRLAKKLNIQKVHPVLEIFQNDEDCSQSVDSVLDFASSQISKGNIISWDLQTATTLGFYLAMVTNQLKKDETVVFSEKVIDFGATVINRFIDGLLELAQKSIDTGDEIPLQILLSKFFDEQSLSSRTNAYEVSKWGQYADSKKIFKVEKFGLDGLLSLIKDTEPLINKMPDNVISVNVGGLFAMETASEMFQEMYSAEKIVKITFQMVCDLITSSIEKLHKMGRIDNLSEPVSEKLTLAAVKLYNSSIFANLNKFPIEHIASQANQESVLNQLLLDELESHLDLSLKEKSVSRSFSIGSSEGFEYLMEYLLKIEPRIVTNEYLLKMFQFVVLIGPEANETRCKFLKLLLFYRSKELVETNMDQLTTELLGAFQTPAFSSSSPTIVSQLREVLNEKCDVALMQNLMKQLTGRICTGVSGYDLQQLVELANLIKCESSDVSSDSFAENESLGHGHLDILAEIEKMLGEPAKLAEKQEIIYPAFEYITQLAIYLSMDDESRWMSNVVNQFATGKQDTLRSEKAAKDAKLCTYTHTQREFQGQHWYHCHSCNMIDSVGVCSTCAVVCHEGCNLSYAKHSSFFCDCGAQERAPGRHRSCISLQPRSPGVNASKAPAKKSTDCCLVDCTEEISLNINITLPLVRLRCADALTKLIPKIEAVCAVLQENTTSSKPVDADESAKELLERFQNPVKATVNSYTKADFQTNQGALENVKPSLSPDGNDAIRKVLLENSIHRNFVGVLEEKREKYIVVLQDKNKMSLLALSTLLSRKSNSSTNAVSRQSHYTASFTVMNILPSPYGQFILQSGIREAIIHRIKNGLFGEKISLHLNTPSTDFITQTRWISQIEGYLAISTTRNVKIYNFVEDTMCPLFNFMIEIDSGLIHDFTYFFVGKELHLLVLVATKDGHKLLIKKVTEGDKASENGEVKITTEVKLPEDVVSAKTEHQACSNGVIFYSFQTGVLFLAYTIASSKKGSSFTNKKQVFFALSRPVLEEETWNSKIVAKMPELSCLVKEMLTQKRSFDKDAKSKDAESLKLAPKFKDTGKYIRNLCESTGHPGLLTASYGPHSLAIIFTDNEINVEFLGDVRPILDVSAVVHNFRGGEQPTSSILAIAEDGALRGWAINPAQVEKGELWKNMALANTQSFTPVETERAYPVTFLEDFEIITDSELEYQSNQLQRVYNRQRLRRCLEPGNNTNSHYVTWKGNFALTVKTSKIVRGLRLHFGDNDAASAPHSVELSQFGRIITIGDVTNARWVDIILTPEEALGLEGKLTIEFVPSPTADRKIVVDAIRLYKTSRRAIMSEKKKNDSKHAKKSSLFKGPKDKTDSLRWSAVKSYVASAHLVTKSSQRSKFLENTWKFLDCNTASPAMIQQFKEILPAIDFDMYCDIHLSKSLPSLKKFDWMSLQNVIDQIYVVAENRPANFRGYFTNTLSLNFFKLIANTFHDLIKSTDSCYLPDIYPKCKNLRDVSKKLVFILSMVSLLDTSQLENATKFLRYSSESSEISLGMKDAILIALKFELPESATASKSSADVICVEDNDDEDADTVVGEEGMHVDDDDEDEDDDEDDEDDYDIDDDDHDDDEDDVDMEEEEFSSEILDGGGEVFGGNNGIVVEIPNDIRGFDLDRLLQENDSSIADLALALSIQADQRRQDPPITRLPIPSVPDTIESDNINEDENNSRNSSAEAEVKAPEEDPIYSKERQRQFAMKLIPQILANQDESDIRTKYQLILAALSKLNVDEPDELEMIESVMTSIVVKIKETRSLLHIVILSELLKFNIQFTPIISLLVTNHGIIDSFTDFIKENVFKSSPVTSKKKAETNDGEFKPFIIPQEFSESEELGTISAMLRFLEQLKENESVRQIPHNLLDLVIKVIVRENSPKWFVNTFKRFGLSLTQSAEKFKARLDRERLIKSFEKVQLHAEDESLSLTYSQLSELYEEIKMIVEIAQKRPGSWQKFVESRPHIIELILNLPTNMECCNKDIIKLLEVIVSPVASATQKSRKQSECEKRKRSKSQGSAKSTPENFVDKFLDAKRSCSLIAHPQFVRKNLFSESESIRWAMHSLMKTLFADCSDAKKCVLVDFLWTMFNASVRFGQRAIQYTDLLGFFTIKSGMPPATLKNYGDLVAKTLNSQLTQLSTHSNSLLYSRLAEQLSFGGFYLESQLCLSCNTQNEELTLSTITGLKGDTKFTTTAQIYKLKAGQEIQRVNMKLTDVKRTRHIKTMTLYYTTRTSIPIIELKNSPHLWLKAKTVQLTQGQSDVSFNLPVSIKVNFLIVEFSSFYDESYSIPETLPCPRCSNNVHTDPGICGNCGENVFQCHKCRMINYDERDPFICTQCGFCRYAKFSLSMLSRNCTIADPVETEDERKRAEIELKKQLVKADATWEKLIVQRRELEDSCYDIEYSGEESKKEAKPKAQPLVIKYNECKTSHNDITSMIRAANACRETLADYERRSNLNAVKSETKISAEKESASMSSCYGCAVNGAENNLTLIRALCQIASVRENLIADGAVEKLLSSPPNLGSSNLRKLIRRAICRLVRGSKEASKELGERLKDKIIKLAKQNQTIARLDVLLREDLELLKQSLKYRDCGWEYRIKAAMAIFLEASELCETVSSGTTIVNGVLLPCLAILKKQTSSQEKENSRTSSPYDVNYRKWADGDADHQFETRKANRIEEDNSLDEGMKKPLALPESFWLPRLMFCKWSQEARIQACSVVSNLARSRKTEIIELMVSYFKHVNEAGEFAVEYLGLLRNLLVKEQEIDSGLASLLLRGLGDILISQINDLVQQENEVASMTTISSSTDLRVGKSLDAIVLLLITIIDKSNNPFKMIKPILRGYLSLCRVSILRTKAIDDAQDGLLKLLETLTSGGEDIARDFVKICFRTLSHFSKEDFQTSQFVFERLCNIIRPESTEDESFRVQIDKDPLQEEFLPGRMVNNPYPSSVVGETIRDLKNKICRDTELIAMVDDDTSLELLVSNKIVKLDLAVSDVYKKIWLQNHETNVPMRVIYRMRGLMGEATEEFVETLPEDDQNEEEIFRRASYLAVDNGLDLVLEKMDSIRSLNSRSRPLLGAGLKLLGFCVHLRLCRDALAENSSASMLNIMLQLLNICIEAKEAKFVEDILSIMNRVLAEAASHGQETETGHKHELTKLLNAIDSEFVQSRQNIVMSLMEMIPFLSFGDEQLMEQLINHFDSVLSNLSSFDDSEDEQHKIYLDCFCDILKGLKPDNPGGKHLKDIMYGRNLPRQAIDYLRAKTPSDKNYASDEWKDLLEKPVLPFILRILAGLATGHPECQKLIGEMVIPELHRLEQVAAGGIGTLAEEALEALRDNTDVFKRVSEARRATRKEKAKVGKTHRMKTLMKLGMAENTDGTIKADESKSEKLKLANAEDGPLCVICKEGCQFEPKKIMSIYCFCKRATVEPFEGNSRKTVGFEIVSSFNLIHNECHKKAVVAKRSRDEWETSFLHNNNTRCNALLPLWGPEVTESDFSTQMARFNESVRDATGVSPDVTWIIHNIKLTLHRFTTNGKFYLDAGGGGPESNMKFLPHLIHYILYTTNTLKSQSSLKIPIQSFLDDFNISSAWAVTGYYYKATSALIVFSKEEWLKCRVDFLKKMLMCTHMREVSINQKKGVTEAERKELPFQKYKTTILFWYLVDQILDKLLDAQAITDSAGAEYTEKLQMYIRNNTVALQKASEKLAKTFNEEFIVVDSLEEFIDVANLYSVLEPTLVNDAISQIQEDTSSEA